jgi:hypothetical protein
MLRKKIYKDDGRRKARQVLRRRIGALKRKITDLEKLLNKL